MKHIQIFQSFLKNEVNLNQTRIDRLDDSVAAVEAYLKDSSTFKDYFQELIPQGSYAHRTIIRPTDARKEFDADVLLHMNQVETWSAKDYVENLYTQFRDSGVYKEKVGRKTRCVTIDYADDFHIDVVPFFTSGGLGYITNRHEDSYEWTKPEEFTSWLEEKNAYTSGHLVHVVRLLKYLRDFKGTFAIKSIIFTALIGDQINAYDTINEPGCYDDLPTALRSISKRLSVYLQANPTMPAIYDPAGTGEDFAKRWHQDGYAVFRDKIKGYAEKIEEAYLEENAEKSLAKWQDVFGRDFKELVVKQSALLSPASEEFIEKYARVELVPKYSVQITGYVSKSGWQDPYYLKKRGDRVRKDRSIEFRVEACNVPAPYDIYWKVRNNGEEATERGQLRGEITKDQGDRRKKESTSYRGNHYVECYIVKDGVCVARARQAVIVTTKSPA